VIGVLILLLFDQLRIQDIDPAVWVAQEQARAVAGAGGLSAPERPSQLAGPTRNGPHQRKKWHGPGRSPQCSHSVSGQRGDR